MNPSLSKGAHLEIPQLNGIINILPSESQFHVGKQTLKASNRNTSVKPVSFNSISSVRKDNSGNITGEHFIIAQEPDGYYISDIHSTNGTFLGKINLKTAGPQLLHEGDIIILPMEEAGKLIQLKFIFHEGISPDIADSGKSDPIYDKIRDSQKQPSSQSVSSVPPNPQPSSAYQDTDEEPEAVYSEIRNDEMYEEFYEDESVPTNSGIYHDLNNPSRSFILVRKQLTVPPNAFSPNSGVDLSMVYKLEKSEFWHISVAFLLLFTMVYHTSLNTSLITLIIAGDWGSMSLFRLFIDPIPIAFIFGLTFLVHELSHLNTGKHFKYQSRFCLTKVGIKTTSWAALIGIPFGLPGAAISVGVDPNHDKHQMGWIKIAGPASNFVLGLIFLIGGLVIPVQSILLFKIKFYLLQGASINFVLGAFNMIPRVVKGFALDGEYIIKWNILYYIILVLLLIAGFAGTYLVLNWLQNPDTLQAFIDQSIFTYEDFGKYIR